MYFLLLKNFFNFFYPIIISSNCTINNVKSMVLINKTFNDLIQANAYFEPFKIVKKYFKCFFLIQILILLF